MAPYQSAQQVEDLFTRGAMLVNVSVGLLSGRTTTLEARIDENVDTFKIRAQKALGVGFGLLVDKTGSILDESLSIMCAKVQNGDSLTLQVRSVQACASSRAFATILGDGYVASCGKLDADESSVERHGTCFKDPVQHIRASDFAFAAILGDGSVVTWGDAGHGGDSSAVQDQLKNVQKIQATGFAFAAVLGDGSVVTWGAAGCGGDSSAVQHQLQNVQHSL